MSDGDFLSRWSRRKIEARKPAPAEPAPAIAPAEGPRAAPDAASTADRAPAPLPPVESLTPESDFSPFMRSEVDPITRRTALKTLFQDPRFNVMDGLDVYIDDYSKPDPLPEGWLAKMTQSDFLGDKGQRDADEKAAAAAAEADRQAAEIPSEKQTVAEAAPPPPSDTLDAIPPPPELKES